MVTWAHPQMYKSRYMLASNGLSDTISSYETKNSVTKYLKEVKKNKEKKRVLYPKCMCLVESELHNLQWADECFESYVLKMFSGADLSQLKSFYSRYQRMSNKTAFFLRFCRDEL